MAPTSVAANGDSLGNSLDQLRTILVRTLSAENVAKSDIAKVKEFTKKYHNTKYRQNDVGKRELNGQIT